MANDHICSPLFKRIFTQCAKQKSNKTYYTKLQVNLVFLFLVQFSNMRPRIRYTWIYFRTIYCTCQLTKKKLTPSSHFSLRNHYYWCAARTVKILCHLFNAFFMFTFMQKSSRNYLAILILFIHLHIHFLVSILFFLLLRERALARAHF